MSWQRCGPIPICRRAAERRQRRYFPLRPGRMCIAKFTAKILGRTDGPEAAPAVTHAANER